MFKTTTIFFVILFISISLFSQEQVLPQIKKSTDKVKIDGKYYFIHIVRKGETLYSISKAYEVNQMDIAMENPDIYLGIQVDQALKIPIKNYTDENENELYIFHIVKKGETLFGLSRKYQVEIDDIVKVNPDVQSGLMLSQVLRIPREKVNTLGQKAIPDSIRFIFHQVRQKEGLYSISKLYKVDQKVIEKFNSDILINGLKYGSVLKIPRNPADTALLPKSEVISNIVEVQKVEETNHVDLPNVLCDTFNYHKYKLPLNVALILPFETNKIASDSTFKDYINSYPGVNDKIILFERSDLLRSFNILDFYQGFLLAIEKLKQEGVSVNLSVFDTQKDYLNVNSLLKEKAIVESDLIIGPVFPESIKPVAEFAKANRKIIVSPLSPSGHLLHENPYFFQVPPSFQTQFKEFVSKISVCDPNNLIVIYEDDSTNINMIDQFKNLLNNKISICQNSDSLHFKEMSYKPGGNTVETKEKINQSLILEKENIIFVPSDNEAFVSDCLSHIFALKTYYGYNIKVYGFPKWQRFKNIPTDYFYTLNVHLFSQNFLDYTKQDVKNFISNYRTYFKSEPTQFSFAGYDNGFYFMSALMKYGKDFRSCIPTFKVDLLQTSYQFEQINPTSGFENKSIFIIQYNKDFDIIRVK